jgi:hypothetical protein
LYRSLASSIIILYAIGSPRRIGTIAGKYALVSLQDFRSDIIIIFDKIIKFNQFLKIDQN